MDSDTQFYVIAGLIFMATYLMIAGFTAIEKKLNRLIEALYEIDDRRNR